MSRASLKGGNEARVVSANDSKQREDLKMYSQLPDYDDFQGYDLWKEDISRQVVQRIYANFHKPSWRTLKRHLFSAGFRKNFPVK